MPWTIVEQDDEFCVFKEDAEGEPTGEAIACHETESAAMAQVAAMVASEEKSLGPPLKMLPGGRVSHYLVLWGDESRKDLTGEWFTPETEELTAIFDAVGKLPLLYAHGTDKLAKTTPVGTIDMIGTDDWGMWYQAQLSQAEQYQGLLEKIGALADKGSLGTSSGTLPGAREVDTTGKILRWPIAEGSLTPSPAEHRMLERPLEQIKAAYKAVNLELPSDEGAEDARARELEMIGFDLLTIEAETE